MAAAAQTGLMRPPPSGTRTPAATGIANAEESLARALEIAQKMSVQLADPMIETARHAFMSGYHTAIAVSIALVGLSAVIAAALLRPRHEESIRG